MLAANGVDGNDRAEGAAAGAGLGAAAAVGAYRIVHACHPGVGPIIGAGWLVAPLTGAAAGAATSCVLGALTSWCEEEDADVYAEGLRRGGAVVSAPVSLMLMLRGYKP